MKATRSCRTLLFTNFCPRPNFRVLFRGDRLHQEGHIKSTKIVRQRDMRDKKKGRPKGRPAKNKFVKLNLKRESHSRANMMLPALTPSRRILPGVGLLPMHKQRGITHWD